MIEQNAKKTSGARDKSRYANKMKQIQNETKTNSIKWLTVTLTEIERETKHKKNWLKSYEDNIQNTNEKIRVDRHIYREKERSTEKPGGGRDNQGDPQRRKKDLAVYQQNCHSSQKRETK